MTTAQHAAFLERLKNSSRAVFAVAFNQHQKGRLVEIPPLHFAPSAKDAERHADSGDLFFFANGRRYRIEVKHLLKADFTCAADWPYPHAFAGSVSQVKRWKGSVYATVIVSANMRHAAIIKRGTAKHWYVVEVRSDNTGNVEAKYACPIEHVEFMELEEL
jgi:hypothetical protein